jgi:hypothetical protein
MRTITGMTAISASVIASPIKNGPPLSASQSSMRATARASRSSAPFISFSGKPVRPMVSRNSLRSGLELASARNSSSLIA